MGHIFIPNKVHQLVKNHKKEKGSIDLSASDLIQKGDIYRKMCKAVSTIAQEQNKTPEGVVKEIFYNALEYKSFLDKNIPV